MEMILSLILGFLVGFLSAGYIHYRKCRKSGLTRTQAIQQMVGGGGNPHEPL